MENVNSLKHLAMGVASSEVITQPNNLEETEIPTAEEIASHQSDNNVSFVGDTPVIIGSVKPMEKEQPDVESDFMQTPPIVASTVGLDMDTLDTPMINTPLTPMSQKQASSIGIEDTSGISATDHDMLAELAPDLSVEERIEKFKHILDSRESIEKDLIMRGFTPDEAAVAATNQIRKKITEEYNEMKSETTGVVTIDKTSDPNNLGLTREEHQKLEKVKKVRLVVVEDMDLANIKIERPDEEHKADYIKSIEGSLSKYAIPMPMLGDFVSFKGAQMVQMVNLVNYEDARIDEIISTKASLIYEKLTGGSILQKYDSTGKSIMSYQEFANKFAYQDIDMALYGILCASSMEENSTSLTCQSCSHEWMQNYNLKTLLKLDNISPEFKERVDNILKHKNNDIEMRKLYENMRKASRFKSPFTNNIYDLSYPTIARATNLLKRINPDDTVMTYLSAVALYLSKILIYNEAKGTYVEVTADETPLLLETMKSISNEDINMLAKQIRDDLYYVPQFILSATCPSCGKKSEIPVSVEQLIFLIARDSMVEIDN